MSNVTNPLVRAGSGPAPSRKTVDRALNDEVMAGLDDSPKRKVCTACQRRRALSLFAKDRRAPGGYRNQCRECVQTLRKARRAKKNAVDPKEQAVREASRKAVQTLIQTHQAEFRRLINTEMVLMGQKTASWVNLTSEHALSE